MGAQYVTQIKTKDGNKKIDYNALANLPSIPEKTSDLENDKGFLTEVPVALDNTYGGIKAEFKSDNDNVEVKIGLNGKLYVPEYPDINDFASTTVNYTEQNLTDEQKAQARKNIDVPSTGDVINAPTTEVVPGHLVIWDTDSQSVKDGGEIPVPKEIDTTLTISGAAADAKIVGDKINSMNDTLSEQIEELAKNSAVTLSELPETGSESVDYFIGNAETGYKLYRWINGEFRLIGGDVANDVAFVELSGKVDNIETEIGKHSERILDVENELDSLGNVVTDITSTDNSVTVYYTDGTNKTIDLGDDTVLVKEIASSQTGILVTYSDGTQEEIKITGAGDETGSGYGTITRLTNASTQCIYGGECLIGYRFSAYDSAGDVVGNGTATWTVGGIERATSIAYQYEDPLRADGELIDNYFDIGEYLNVGSNTVKLSISVDTGGDVPTVVTKTWTINAIDMYLEWKYDDATVNSDNTFTIQWTPYGSLLKTTHIIIDGKEVATSDTTRTGTVQAITLDSLTHGSHMVELYLTATVNESEIKSDSVYHDMIFDRGKGTTVISSSYPGGTITQYDTLQIPVVAYNPNSLTCDIVLAINGEETATWTKADRVVRYWNFTPTEPGKYVLTITVGDVVKTINITVEKLDIDIEPVSAGLAFDFNPVGYSNDNENRLWSDGDISMTVSDNFDWINGGYQLDENNETYFCIKAGTTAVINYKMFCNSQNIKSQGGHFKLVFKTTKVQNAESPFMQCYKDNVGVIMQPHETNLYAGSGNQLYLAYSEEDIIEFELNMGEAVNSTTNMVMGYEDGVATKPLVYSTSATFVQGINDNDAEYITLGSESCDLHIYRFKAYRRALASSEVLDNFILDARNAQEMLARYDRNQIYKEGVTELDTVYLAEMCPDLRIIMISAPRFTKDKSDKVPEATIRCIYKNGRATEDNWVVTNALFSGQGTSSNLYGAAGRNLDLIMNKATNGVYPTITFGDGSTLSDGELKVTLTETSVPVDYLNVKVNIASSENANNALLAKRYNKYNPYQRPLVREEGYAYDVKDTMEFQNCVVFIQETDETVDVNGNYINHTEFNDTSWHFYAIGNIGDSKKTDVTRMNDPDDVNEFVIEIMDNNLPNSKFQSGVEDEKGYSITGVAIREEWQTYKDNTFVSDNKYTEVTNSKYLINENLPIFYEFNGEGYILTSDSSIDTTKTYYEINYPNAAYSGLYKDKYALNEKGEVELESGWGISFECRYEHDDSDHAEHRRIWNEFYEFVIFSSDEEFYANLEDYCVLDSVMFYYLFTLRYTMIDNRAKNSFFHYGKCEDGIYRWDLTMDYDND